MNRVFISVILCALVPIAASAAKVARKPGSVAACDRILTSLASTAFPDCTYSRGGKEFGNRELKVQYAKELHAGGTFTGDVSAFLVRPGGGGAGFGLFQVGEGSEDRVQCPNENLIKFKSHDASGSIALDDGGGLTLTLTRKIGADVATVKCK